MRAAQRPDEEHPADVVLSRPAGSSQVACLEPGGRWGDVGGTQRLLLAESLRREQVSVGLSQSVVREVAEGDSVLAGQAVTRWEPDEERLSREHLTDDARDAGHQPDRDGDVDGGAQFAGMLVLVALQISLKAGLAWRTR